MTALGDAIRDRRNELGITQIGLGSLCRTVARIELGAPGPFRRGTLARIDESLAWKPGTSAAILAGTAGDDPTVWRWPLREPAVVRAASSTLSALAPTLCPYVAPALLDQAVRAVADLFAAEVAR